MHLYSINSDVKMIGVYACLHHTNKHDEHNGKYSDNKVYQITIPEIGETVS